MSVRFDYFLHSTPKAYCLQVTLGRHRWWLWWGKMRLAFSLEHERLGACP
jgi:hypothetical protein